jgi:hypothetical protein
MTTPPEPPPTDPDELASAIVDGLLSPETADRARRDPAVVQRVDDILQVRSTIRDTPPSPPGALDAALASALNAYDAARPGRTADPRHLRPVPPPARRQATGFRRAGSWLAAAAAIVIVGLVAVSVLRQNDHDAADQASTAASAEDRPTTEAGGSESGDLAPEAAPEAEAGAARSAVYIGSAETTEELEALVEQNRSRTDTQLGNDSTAPNSAADGATCIGLSDQGDPARGTTVFVGDAEYQGKAVRVHVYELAGTQHLVATDTASCTDVVDVPFTP